MRRYAIVLIALATVACQALLVFENEHTSTVVIGNEDDASDGAVAGDRPSALDDGARPDAGGDGTTPTDPCADRIPPFLFCDTFETGSRNLALRGDWSVPGGNTTISIDTSRGKDSSASLSFTNQPYNQNIVWFSRPLGTNTRYAFELDFAIDGTVATPGLVFASIRFGQYMLRLSVEPDMRFAFHEYNFNTSNEIQVYVASANAARASANWVHLQLQFTMTSSVSSPSDVALYVDGIGAAMHDISPTDRDVTAVQFNLGDENAPNFASTIHVDNVRLYANP